MGNCTEGFASRAGAGGVGQGAKPRVELKYFPITGRAESIRLALVLGKFDFADTRILGKEWGEGLKKQMPYGQLPVLVVERSTTIAQTKSILRYVGKLANVQGRPLYPADPLAAAKVDEILDAFDDLWILLAPTYRIVDAALREQERKSLFGPDGRATRLVLVFEAALAESQRRNSEFVVPEAGLSVADLVYFSMLNTLRSGFVEGLGPDLFDAYANIKKHKEMIACIPEIKSYYEDASRSNPNNMKIYEVFRPGK